MEDAEGPIPLAKMIDAHVDLLSRAHIGTDVGEYRRGWPAAVNPIASYRHRFPCVVPVDRAIGLEPALAAAGVSCAEDPASFADVPEAAAMTGDMHRYVVYAHDGFGRFARGLEEAVGDLRPDELPLTAMEGAYFALHHARSHHWRHGVVCAGSRDARGRYPVIAAVSRGFLLTAVEPSTMLFRFSVARRGLIIPAAF